MELDEWEFFEAYMAFLQRGFMIISARFLDAFQSWDHIKLNSPLDFFYTTEHQDVSQKLIGVISKEQTDEPPTEHQEERILVQMMV